MARNIEDSSIYYGQAPSLSTKGAAEAVQRGSAPLNPRQGTSPLDPVQVKCARLWFCSPLRDSRTCVVQECAKVLFVLTT